MKRTHTCGELKKADVGKKATLCGWVHNRRDHGKLVFIDIRDRYGFTQVVFVPSVSKETHKIAEKLKFEDAIMVSGDINERPKGTINPKIPTGEVEICATSLEILNPCKELPFGVSEYSEVSEELRYTYRYLDLRRPQAMERIILRHKITKAIRDFLNSENFVDIETPVLTKSTPEGARDFLVPSRLSPGQFYALPQSPQLFKQILMMGGLDRYYQLAKCFRDEDLRADRQPEFAQLDMEMAFIEEDDIFCVTEGLFKHIFKAVLDIDIKTPFERISYKDAIKKYKSDKPDLRKDKSAESKEFKFAWITDFPLFKYNEDEKRWDSEHHPFTSPRETDIPNMEKDPGSVTSCAYDLVLNGNEIGSGSIRIHRPDLQKKIFKIIGMPDDEAKQRFGFLLKALSYGAPPHGGIAFGIGRLTALMAGCDTIREVIAFPKTQKGACPLTDAPSAIDAKQLGELGLSLRKKR